jgi:hypothetical protein
MTVDAVRGFTMTSEIRLFALCNAVRYLVRHNVPGDLVECGVWRGGSMMAAARTLLECGDTTRCLYLFDTFTGMEPPSAKDERYDGKSAALLASEHDWKGEESSWVRAEVEEVRANMASVGYPMDRVRLVEGKVQDTIPAAAPEQIALLRLDTDWYDSTRHELDHLYPRLTQRGVLLIDDYGCWKGARQAVDEWLAETGLPILLNRVDYSARIAVVP